MKQVMWVLVAAIAAGLGYWLWYALRSYGEKKQAEEARFAGFLAQSAIAAIVKPPAEDALALAQQKLLFEAASKAGEAGEAALSIQLYARLVARYPAGSFAGEAKAAVEAQKKKLTKPQSA